MNMIGSTMFNLSRLTRYFLGDTKKNVARSLKFEIKVFGIDGT